MINFSYLKRSFRDAKARIDAAEIEARADLRSMVGGKGFWLVVAIVVALALHLYFQGRLTW